MDITGVNKARGFQQKTIALLEAERLTSCDGFVLARRYTGGRPRHQIAIATVAMIWIGIIPGLARGALAIVLSTVPLLAIILWATFRVPNNYVFARFAEDVAVVALKNLTTTPKSVQWFSRPAPATIHQPRWGLAPRVIFDDYTFYFPNETGFRAARDLLDLEALEE